MVMCVVFYLSMNTNYVKVNGETISFSNAGNMVFTAAVIITNIKILIVSVSYNVMLLVTTFGSIALYFVVYFVESAVFKRLPIGETFWEDLKLPYFYLSMILIVFFTSGIDASFYRKLSNNWLNS